MGFLLFCVGSVIVSFFVEITVVMKIFKTACEEGYKIDMNHSQEVLDGIVPEDNDKRQTMILLTPGINLVYSFNFSIMCMQSLDQVIDQFDAMDSLVRMTSDEQRRFEAKPTLMTALLITCEYSYSQSKEEQSKQHLECAHQKSVGEQLKQDLKYDYHISINTDEEKSEYYYKYKRTEDGEDFIIVKVEGDAERLSLEEQKNNIHKYTDYVFPELEPDEQEKGQISITENSDVELEVDKYLQSLEGLGEEDHQVEEDSKQGEEKPKQYKKGT